MKLAAYLILLVGIAILAYAYSIAPYKDEALFMERYMALSAGQSNEYWQLRDEMLTPKFQLQNYGGTLVTLAVAVFFVSRRGWQQLKSPKSRVALLGLAFATPFLTVGAYVFDLLQAFDRGEFPHWADSMGIPLMGVPVNLVVLLLWSGAHLAFLRGPYQPVFLSQAISRQANWWLLVIAALTALLSVLFAFEGAYWYAIPGVAWLYFYVSLAAVRRSTYAAEPGGQSDATR
ncbi:MAG: hypothetical protein AB1899_03630 [Pseudomonadota bacterium]